MQLAFTQYFLSRATFLFSRILQLLTEQKVYFYSKFLSSSGTGRRDSAAQISPPNELQEPSPIALNRRRRSSLAQLTDIFRELRGGSNASKLGGSTRSQKIKRRETLADFAKSQPWASKTTTDSTYVSSSRKRRESSVDSGIRSQVSNKSTRRDSTFSDLKNDLARFWSKKDEKPQAQQAPTVISPTPRRGKK